MKPAATTESKSVIQKKTRRANHPDTIKLYPEIDTPKVRQFVDAKARNSVNTAKGYREGIYRLAQFLKGNYPQYDIETITQAKELDFYKVIDQYITFLSKRNLSTATIKVFVAAVRNYFQYNDIEIVPWKFKNKVTMPKDRKEDEYALDKEEIRKILVRINNRRLKAFCAVLACAGMRPVEALAIRNKDIDFTLRPTKLYMQAKYAKNKLPREVYITTEASEFLKDWLIFKYEDGRRNKDPDDLVFAVMKDATPQGMYGLVAAEFRDVLKSADLDDKKDTGKAPRGKITLYSFRRFVKTTLEDKSSYSMSEYILGHKKSVYYTKKEHERREKYAECERFLTYLDYTAVDQQTKSLESQQSAAQVQIAAMQKQIDDLKLKAEEAAVGGALVFETMTFGNKYPSPDSDDQLKRIMKYSDRLSEINEKSGENDRIEKWMMETGSKYFGQDLGGFREYRKKIRERLK